MSLPLFPAAEDPGPSFLQLQRRLGLDLPTPPAGSGFEVTHGTTIVALRYADGVVMAGDRRATAGSSIAHRAMDKVHPADRFSGVAIAGAAGFALEMVKALQLQLERYGTLERWVPSRAGNANQPPPLARR